MLEESANYKVVLNALLSFDLLNKEVQRFLLDGLLGNIYPFWLIRSANKHLRWSFNDAIKYMGFDPCRKMREVCPLNLIMKATS
jgi:hypothetical protein